MWNVGIVTRYTMELKQFDVSIDVCWIKFLLYPFSNKSIQ